MESKSYYLPLPQYLDLCPRFYLNFVNSENDSDYDSLVVRLIEFKANFVYDDKENFYGLRFDSEEDASYFILRWS